MESYLLSSDSKSVKRFLFLFLLTVSFAADAYSYKLLYAEEYYKLYHRNLYMYQEDYTGNIWFLEQALSRPFVNPLNALTRISNRDEWERYRYLFYMHVNLKLVEQYRHLARSYDKQTAYFFNAPWKEDNLKSLDIAENYYRIAFHYWKEASRWKKKLDGTKYFFLEGIQNWEDERVRISDGELDYGEILNNDIEHLKKVRADFEAMDENTY